MTGHDNTTVATREQFWQWYNGVLRSGPSSPITRMVLIAIGSFVDVNAPGSGCSRGASEIAKRASISTKAVRAHVAKAEDAGWLQVGRFTKPETGLNLPNSYRLTIPPAVRNEVPHVGNDIPYPLGNDVPDGREAGSVGVGNDVPPRALSLNISDKKEREPRGTRFSLQALPDDWRRYCAEKRPDLDPAETFDRFRDFWIAQPGAKGRKTDWLATWRNWIRRENEFRKGNRKPEKPISEKVFVSAGPGEW